MNSQIELIAADGFHFPVYQAQPKGPVLGAVVVVQEIFGVNAHVRAVADGFAAQGYLALAPSTFHRVKPGVEMGYTPDDIAAAVAFVASDEASFISGIAFPIDGGALAGPAIPRGPLVRSYLRVRAGLRRLRGKSTAKLMP